MVTGLLLAATALHLGFQLVVTAVVYPALLGALRTGPEQRWAAEHAAHRRRITPVVGVVYGLLAAACAAVLVEGPRGPWSLAAVGASLAVVVVTATSAGPAHGQLAERGWSDGLARRLRRADALRLVLAVAAALAAGLAAAAVLHDGR